ncbi:MAG: 4Fe-4S binding protein [Clostridiales bacterium]|nr:4Fe-4S binding protein [Clostridiales bacterium]
MNYTLTNVFFSPGGSTATVSSHIASALSTQIQTIDLLRNQVTSPLFFGEKDLLVISIPVFAGRIPMICTEMLSMLKGQKTPAIISVVYGNRAYDDALLELFELVTQNGFLVAGAAAFVARHSIFPDVAKDRPNEMDLKQIESFAKSSFLTIQNSTFANLPIPGNNPYRKPGNIPLHPTGNSKCIRCGICSKLCPVDAICIHTPKKTDTEKCISCTACIYHCPQNARAFRGVKYLVASKGFQKKYSTSLQPDFFLEHSL